ncbi:penicillin-binding protein 1B [Ferrimonas sediminicola]|uniref:Penicillin-binding protein 1B n=1 Tax=Ferrimonas sediminicola TaxID=2569538 RepID=A0A4U1BJD8_9GAMM|nr:penicillin-binding protein 1B [Ferrimonas sediminicola]TKB51493.1 penicillin-binding protein 1B [Ferrimonas sediminicola]
MAKNTTSRPASKGTRTKAPARKRSACKPRSKRWGGRLLGMTLVGLLLLSGITAAYCVYLDQIIADKFEGQRWHLPAQIYARPMAIYPGAPITHAQLKQELALLGYRNTGHPQREGEFAVAKERVELYKRAYDGPGGFEPAQKVMITFSNNRVSRLQRSSDGRDLGFVHLEALLLDRIVAGDREDRLFIPREQIPESLVNALLRTEDREFYHHHGVAPLAIARALVVNLKAGRTVQGGSTLTQQLAKNFFLTRERSLWRKVREALMALIIDYRYDKDTILEAYLNEVYMGQDGSIGVHGVGLAARFYFHRPIEELTIGQQATLVAMIKGPSYYNPWRFPDRVAQRRDLVLKLMLEEGLISRAQYQQAAGQGLGVRSAKSRQRHRVPAFMQQVRQELASRYGPQTLKRSGLKIYTTLDPLAQRAAESAVSQGVTQLSRDRKDDRLQGAMVVVDRYQGGILAMVGDKDPDFKGFNRARDAYRPIGSLVKPFVYLSALAQPQAYNLATPVKDEPITLKSSGGITWSPKNNDKQYRGQVSLSEGLVRSYNVPTVNLGMNLGLEAVMQTLEDAGWREPINPVPSLLLGAMEGSPLALAQIYQTLANGGRLQQLHSVRHVLDQDNLPLAEHRERSRQALPERAVYLVNNLLTQVVARGTGHRLGQAFPGVTLAGKTGTSSDGRDAWFAGFDDRDVVITWVGRDDNGAANLYGSSAALPLYRGYLAQRDPLSLVLTPPEGTLQGYFNDRGVAVAEDCHGARAMPADAVSWPSPSGCDGAGREKNWLERMLGF